MRRKVSPITRTPTKPLGKGRIINKAELFYLPSVDILIAGKLRRPQIAMLLDGERAGHVLLQVRVRQCDFDGVTMSNEIKRKPEMNLIAVGLSY